jgi:hypothetical protein
MLITFQILLLLVIVYFSLAMVASTETKESRLNYTSVVLASIIAEVVCFVVL